MGRTRDFTRMTAALSLFKDAISDPAVSLNELQAFLVIASAGEEGIPLADIEKRANMSQVAVSRNVAALSKFDRWKKPGPNLVELKLDPADYRRKTAHLTAKGARLAAHITEALG